MRRTALVLLLALMWPILAEGHPGRLDKIGCHRVHKEFHYKSGKVAKRGEYHCHRLLTVERLVPAIILDGREVLMDRRGDTEREEEDPREEQVQGP